MSTTELVSRPTSYLENLVPGRLCVNGSAARLVHKGDKLIIMAFEYTDSPITAKVALVDEKNRFVRSL